MMTAVVALAVALAAAGCGIRPLTSAELYGVAGHGGSSAGDGGASGGAGVGGGHGGAGGAAGTGGMDSGMDGLDAAADAPGDADAGPTDDAAPDGSSERPDSACADACGSDQFCDELTGRCASSTGSGMLGGIVVDDCSGAPLSALVGIAGQHTCSYPFKGSYFFGRLPLGTLKLAAVKDGYDLYGDTVDIVAGGVVRDIRLARAGGCAAPAPVDLACTCTASSCTP